MLRWLARGRGVNALGPLPIVLLVLCLPMFHSDGFGVVMQVCLAMSAVVFVLLCLRLWWLKPASDRTWSGAAAALVAPLALLFAVGALGSALPGTPLDEFAADVTFLWLYLPLAVVGFTVACVLGYLKTRDLDHLGLLLAGYTPLAIGLLVAFIGVWLLTRMEPVP